MPRTRAKRHKELPGSQQVFRYWVEVLELKNGSVRILPLNVVAKIHIPKRKNDAQKPTEEILQLKDGSATLEAKSLDDLATQLRERHPDVAYERMLRRERDREAEERRADAMNKLLDILVEAVVKEAAKADVRENSKVVAMKP